MSSFRLWPLALAFAAHLLLAPAPAHSTGFDEAAKALVEACPGLVTRDFPKATPEDIQVICTCMRSTVAAAAKEHAGKMPTDQQWADLGLRTAQQCAGPLARKDTVRRCVGSATWRQQLTRSAGLSDAQFDRYCDCHVNLAFDEAAKGANINDPQAQRALLQKSQAQCVAPLQAEKPAK